MGYASGGGRWVREKFNTAADQPYTPSQAKVQVVPTSLAQARYVALASAKADHGSPPAGKKLGERQVSRVKAETAYIRFQATLRGVHPGNLDAALEQLGVCAPALSRTRNDLATLVWLGSEFAENLLSVIYTDKKNATLDPKREQEIGEAFARHAAHMMGEGRLKPEAFNALLAGFAAGVRGLSGHTILQDSKGSERLSNRQQLADNSHASTALVGLKAGLKKAGLEPQDVRTAQALRMAGQVQTLPELMEWVRLGTAGDKSPVGSGRGESSQQSDPPGVTPRPAAPVAVHPAPIHQTRPPLSTDTAPERPSSVKERPDPAPGTEAGGGLGRAEGSSQVNGRNTSRIARQKNPENRNSGSAGQSGRTGPVSADPTLSEGKSSTERLDPDRPGAQGRLSTSSPSQPGPRSVDLALSDAKNRLEGLALSIEQEQQRLAGNQPASVDPASVNLALFDTKARLERLANSVAEDQQRLATDTAASIDPASVNLALFDTKSRLEALAQSVGQEQQRLRADTAASIDPASVNLALFDTKSRLETLARSIEQEQQRLATHSTDRRDSLYGWRPQLLQARQAAESQKKSLASQGNLDHLLPIARELADSATDRGLEFADDINRMRKPIPEQAMRKALIALARSELLQEQERLSKLAPPDSASRSALVARLEALHAQAQQALFTSILKNLSASQPARDDFARHLLATRAYTLNARRDESGFIDQLYLALIQHAASEEQENADKGWSQALAKARRGATDPGHGAGSKDAGSTTETQAPRDLKGQVTDGGEEDDFEAPAVETDEPDEAEEIEETGEADGEDVAGESSDVTPGIFDGQDMPQEPASSPVTGPQAVDRPAVDLSTVVQSIRLKDQARAELTTLLAPTGMGRRTVDWPSLLEEVVRLMDLAGPQAATAPIADDEPSATGMAPLSWNDVGRLLGQRRQLQDAARSVDFSPHTALLVAAMASVGNATDRAACMKGLVGTVADTGLAAFAAAIFTAAEMTRARETDPAAFRSLCEALLERSQSARLAPDLQDTLSDIQAVLREAIGALAPVEEADPEEPSLSDIHAAREALARARSDLKGLLSAPAPYPEGTDWSEHVAGIGNAMERIEDGWKTIPAELQDPDGASQGRSASWHDIGLNLRRKLNLQADRSRSPADDVQQALSAAVEHLVDAKALAECVSGLVADAHPENLRLIARKALLTAQDMSGEPHIATFVSTVFESLKAQLDASARGDVPAETIRLRRDVIVDAIDKAQESTGSQSPAAALFRIAHSSFAPAATKRPGDAKHAQSPHT